MGIDSMSARRTPERNSPLLGSSVAVNPGVVATITVGSGTTPLTLTAAQLLVGLLPLNCTDTGTLTLPTATLLAAAIPGIAVGNWFEFTIVNYGDSTATVAVGTGITSKVIDSESAILTTLATHVGARFALVCTGVAKVNDPSTSNTFDLYLLGTSTCTA